MSDPIDIKELNEIMDDDDELLRECFDDFLEDHQDMLSAIQDAIINSNSEELEKTAHALKGSLKYLAAGTAAELAFKLEVMGRDGNIQNAPQSFDNLTDECMRVKEFMADY